MKYAIFNLSAALALGSIACSSLVGADFDDLKERPSEKSSANGGSSGSSSGGKSSAGSGGSNSAGGSESDGGAAGSDTGGSPSSGGSSGDGGTSGGSSGSAGSAGAGGTSGSGGSGGTDSGGDGGDGGDGGEGANTGVMVLNEVKGHGDGVDFVEIYNQGPGSRDVGGYRITDQSNAYTFPTPTVVDEGARVVLLLDDLLPAGGPFDCDNDEPICYHDDWGISQAGETMELRNASNQTVDTTEYPGEPTLGDTESWGRLPDGNGTFQGTPATPADANTGS